MTDPVANSIGQIPVGAATGPSNARPSAPAATVNTLSLSDAQRTLLASILDPVVPGKKTSHDLLVSTLSAIQNVFASFKDDDYIQSIIDKNMIAGTGDIFTYLQQASKAAQARRISAETDKEIIDPLTASLADLETQINAAQPGYLNLLSALNTKITTYNNAVQDVKNKLAVLNPSISSTVNSYKAAVAALNSAAADYNSAMTALQNVNNQYDANFPAKNLPYLLNQYNQTLLNLRVAITNKNNTITLWNNQYAHGDQPAAELQAMPLETLAPVLSFSSPSFINQVALAPPTAQSFTSPVFYSLQPLNATPVAGGGSSTLQSQITNFNTLVASYNSQLTTLNNLRTAYNNALNNLRTVAAGSPTTAAYNNAVNTANTAANNYNNTLSSVFNKLTQMQTQATAINNLMFNESQTTPLSPLTPIPPSLNQTVSALQENLFFYTAATVSSSNVPTPKDLLIPAPIPSLIPTSDVQNFTLPPPLPPDQNPTYQTITDQIILAISSITSIVFGGGDLNDKIMDLSKARTDQAIIYILSALSSQPSDTAQFKVAANAIANQGTNVESSTTHLSSAQLDVVLNSILSNQTFNALIEQVLLTNPALKGLLPNGDQLTTALNQKVVALLTTIVKSSLLLSIQYLQNVLHKDQIDLLSALSQAGVILQQILGVLAKGGSQQLLQSLGIGAGLGEGGSLLANSLTSSILQLGAILYGEAVGNRALFLEQQAIQQSFNIRRASIVENDIKYALQNSDAIQKQILANNLQQALIQENVSAQRAQDVVLQILAGNQSLDLILQQNGLQSLLPVIDQTQQITNFENSLQALANRPSAAPFTPSINRPVSDNTAAAVKEKIEKSLIADGISKEEAARIALQVAQELQKFPPEDSTSLRVIKIRQLLDASLPNANLSTKLLPLVVAQLLSGAQKEQLINFIGEQISLERVDTLVKQQSAVIDHLNELVSKTLAEQRELADANNLRHVLDSNLLKYDKLLHVNSLVNKILDPGSRLTFFGLMYESATNEFKRGYIDIRA